MANKMKDWHKAVLATVIILVAALWMTGYLQMPTQPAAVTYVPTTSAPTASSGGVVVGGERVCLGLAAVPTVTVATYDRYNPATAVTSQNMYRQIGTNTWTDVAGAGTIQKGGYTKIELVAGIDSDDDDAEPYGPYFASYEIPCTETYTWAIPMSNDALCSDLSSTWWNSNDQVGDVTGNNITGTVGSTYNLKFRIKGSYEEDYGNINGPDGELGNLLVIQYNTTNINKLEVTSITRTTNARGTLSTTTNYPVVEANVPIMVATAHSNSSMTLKGYKFPVIESSNEYWVYYYIEVDESAPLSTYFDRTRGGNPVFFLYDGSWYEDTNDGKVKFGFADTTNTNIGAAGYDRIAIGFNAT
jgi:hypothetical protein